MAGRRGRAWTYDFAHDRPGSNRVLEMLAVLDEYTRERRRGGSSPVLHREP